MQDALLSISLTSILWHRDILHSTWQAFQIIHLVCKCSDATVD